MSLKVIDGELVAQGKGRNLRPWDMATVTVRMHRKEYEVTVMWLGLGTRASYVLSPVEESLPEHTLHQIGVQRKRIQDRISDMLSLTKSEHMTVVNKACEDINFCSLERLKPFECSVIRIGKMFTITGLNIPIEQTPIFMVGKVINIVTRRPLRGVYQD